MVCHICCIILLALEVGKRIYIIQVNIPGYPEAKCPVAAIAIALRLETTLAPIPKHDESTGNLGSHVNNIY